MPEPPSADLFAAALRRANNSSSLNGGKGLASHGGGSSGKDSGTVSRSSAKNRQESVSAITSWSKVSSPSAFRRVAMWEERRPCLHAATSQTLVVVMYSLAHSIFARRVTRLSSWLSQHLSSGVRASHNACAAVLHSSFHHLVLKPGAVPFRFMVAAQALLKAS
jgi:hypothetical protein